MDLKELANELDTLKEAKERIDEGETTESEEVDWDRERYVALTALEDELDDLHVASKNLHLINEDDWVDYCRDQAEELYLTGRGTHPLYAYIDWERWAEAMSSDYSQVEFDGETYYYQDQ